MGREQADEQLLIAFIDENNEAAFGALYTKHYKQLVKFFMWLSMPQDEAQDQAQNIFIKIYNNPLLFDRTLTFKSWLYAIAKNRHANYMRDNKVRFKHTSLFAENISVVKEPAANVDQSKIKLIVHALDRLSEKHKEVFILKYVNNLTINEIASVCQCSPGTVKSRLFYSIKKIKNIIHPTKKNVV